MKRISSHSQNFLKDSSFVENLVQKTDINQNDTIIEIGPGKGIITSQLSKFSKQVIAIENDPHLAKTLIQNFENSNNVKIIEYDFLKWNLPNYPYKVFSNIPFNMTADIVNKLFSESNSPEISYLIMQDLAAKRFIGSPIVKDSQISVLLQPFFKMGIVTDIDRHQYHPVPNVNTVLASFEKRIKPLIEEKNKQLYRDFVIYGYNQWRPTVLDSFKDIFSYKQRKTILKKLNIRDAKPTNLNINQWLSLFNIFLDYIPTEKKEIIKGAEKRLEKKQKRMKKEYRTRHR